MERSRALALGLAAWLGLYALVGVELALSAPQAEYEVLADWTRLWTIVGLAAAPACFFLGVRLGTQNPLLVWGLIAVASVGLAVAAIHFTVLHASYEGASGEHALLSASLLMAGIVLFIVVRLWMLWPRRMLWATIVLMVIAAQVLVPNFIRARCGGQATACKSNLKNIGTALEMYAAENAGQYPYSLDALGPLYMKNIPTCPSAGADTYSLEYERSKSAFTVFCMGYHHGALSYPADYPLFGSQVGLQEKGTRTPVPMRRTVRLDDAFLWVRALVLVAGLLMLLDRGMRPLGIGAVVFALAPWQMLIEMNAAPIRRYNDCVGNLLVVRRAVHRFEDEHGGRVPPNMAALGAVPQACPDGEGYDLIVSRDGRCMVVCRGRHHAEAGCEAEYPRWVESDDLVHNH